MSLASLANMYALRTTSTSAPAPAPPGVVRPAPAPGFAPAGALTVTVPQGSLDALVRWIPTESLTLYAALVALSNTVLSTRQSLLVLVVCAVMNVAYVWSLAVHKVVTSVAPGTTFFSEFPSHFPKWEVLLSLVAFLGWVSAIPQSWPTHLSFWDQWYGGAAIVLSAALIPFVAAQLNLAPSGIETGSQ